MSSNLGERDCAWCGGKVVPDDPDDPDCFQTPAHCEDCEAQYLAYWDGSVVTDTSFRSTRRDEPGFADFPKFAIRRGIVQRIPWSDEVAEAEHYYSYWKHFREQQLRACSVSSSACMGRSGGSVRT